MQDRYIPESVRRMIEFFAGKECEECGRMIDGKQLLKHMDHFIPVKDGGQGVGFNIRQTCHWCNLAKGAKTTSATVKYAALAAERAGEVRAHFQESPAHILGNTLLREPQVESYLAIKDYFAEEANQPALVELPTGCGKSGLICIAPYGVSRGRVLVITPNLTINRTIIRAFAPMDNKGQPNAANFHLKCGIFRSLGDLPRFVVLERGQANYEDCLRAEIVIVNIQQMQGWLHLFPDDFFDMILVDEAHHAPAESWTKVNACFPNAKKVYFTATPFRSDGRIIHATTIYQYRLADAMAKGYVKNVMKVDAVATRIKFTVDGETREYGYEEIIREREESWFSKGIALSEVCNATIVSQSVGILLDKRKRNPRHQIIAAACSIRHATQVVALYAARGLRATYVVSDWMSLEEREQRIEDFDAGKYDCIVHVGILGEGYDNPNISVAAVFRPYRSLAPYAQFVGRALRRIEDSNPNDNMAHVVAHIGLNLDRLWEYFKSETREAEILSYIDALDREVDEPSERGHAEEKPCPKVTEEEIARYDVDTFIPVQGVEAGDMVSAITEVIERNQNRALSLPEREWLENLVVENKLLPKAALPAPLNRPDLERKEWRLWLHKDVQRAAGSIMHELEIPTDASMVATVGDGGERTNYEAVIRVLNRALNDAMGKRENGTCRNDWSLDELKRARRALEDVRKDIRESIRRVMGNSQEGRRQFN